MKTLKTILLVAVMALSNGVLANADKTGNVSAELHVKIVAQSDGKVIVGFQKLEDETVQIKIYNREGALVHSEKVTDSKTVLKRFDLSTMPAGKYSYMVTNNIYTVSKVIEKK